MRRLLRYTQLLLPKKLPRALSVHTNTTTKPFAIFSSSIKTMAHEQPTALLPITDGTEDIEAVALADVLSRGGITVTIASVGQRPENIVTLARGVKVQANLAIEACVDLSYDLIVVPGGPGSSNLRDSKVLTELLRVQKHQDRWIGAICAAPATVLHAHGLCPSPATAFPPFEKEMEGIDFRKDERVVVTGKCVTSQGPGTAMEMGVKLVELLCGKQKAEEVAKSLLMK